MFYYYIWKLYMEEIIINHDKTNPIFLINFTAMQHLLKLIRQGKRGYRHGYDTSGY